MNFEATRGKLADAFVVARDPKDVLQRAVSVLAAAVSGQASICAAESLTVLASTYPDAVGADAIASVFQSRDPTSVLNVSDLMFVVSPASDDEEKLRDLCELVAAAWERSRNHAGLVASERRLRMAQELAHLGSYDWDIETDTNNWSDELFRIYGCEPQSFNPSYERFISFIHPDDRDRIRAVHQRAYDSGEPFEMEERIVRPDGSVRILSSNGVVIHDDKGKPIRMTGICWDITEIKQAEHTRMKLSDAEHARRQSLEINDTIVQGLALAAHSLDAGDTEEAMILVQQTLAQARRMAGDLLEQASENGRDLGVLTLSEPRFLPPVPRPEAKPPVAEDGLTRVLVADDTPGMRALIKEFLIASEGFIVVGEAATGTEAIQLAEELTPDLVVLDLSMPEMDGMRAIPHLRKIIPNAGIMVLSGYGGPMVQRALDAGAHAYIEKGAGFSELLPRAKEVVRAVSA